MSPQDVATNLYWNFVIPDKKDKNLPWKIAEGLYKSDKIAQEIQSKWSDKVVHTGKNISDSTFSW